MGRTRRLRWCVRRPVVRRPVVRLLARRQLWSRLGQGMGRLSQLVLFRTRAVPARASFAMVTRRAKRLSSSTGAHAHVHRFMGCSVFSRAPLEADRTLCGCMYTSSPHSAGLRSRWSSCDAIVRNTRTESLVLAGKPHAHRLQWCYFKWMGH